jgi:hypothetical protein
MTNRTHEKTVFKITINDGLDSYEYPLEVSGNASIFSVYEVLRKAYKNKRTEGKHIPPSEFNKTLKRNDWSY